MLPGDPSQAPLNTTGLKLLNCTYKKNSTHINHYSINPTRNTHNLNIHKSGNHRNENHDVVVTLTTHHNSNPIFIVHQGPGSDTVPPEVGLNTDPT